MILANVFVSLQGKAQGSCGQSRRQRLNKPIHAVEMVLCEPKATLTVGVPFILVSLLHILSTNVCWAWRQPESGKALVLVPVSS